MNKSIRNILTDDAAGTRDGWQFDASACENAPLYWAVYLRGAFQHVILEDGDPDGEGATLGRVDNINGQGANIYLEAFRSTDAAVVDEVHGKSEAFSVAHEIGHLFGGLHTDGCVGVPSSDAGLMAQTWQRLSPWFNDVTINKIRTINHP